MFMSLARLGGRLFTSWLVVQLEGRVTQCVCRLRYICVHGRHIPTLFCSRFCVLYSSWAVLQQAKMGRLLPLPTAMVVVVILLVAIQLAAAIKPPNVVMIITDDQASRQRVPGKNDLPCCACTYAYYAFFAL